MKVVEFTPKHFDAAIIADLLLGLSLPFTCDLFDSNGSNLNLHILNTIVIYIIPNKLALESLGLGWKSDILYKLLQ